MQLDLPCVIMTIGIVLVACFAARIAGEVPNTSTSTLSCTSSATRRGIRSTSSFSVTLLNDNGFTVDVTEIAEPLAKGVAERIRIAGSRDNPSL